MDDHAAQSALNSKQSRKWLGISLVIVFLRALPNLRYIIGRDQATYCVIAQGLLHGKLLYRDLWDNKPPGIFYIYAVIVKIFGPVMWSMGVVDIVWLLVFSCCLFYFARRYLGVAGGVLSVIFYAFRHCRQGYLHAAQTETFEMLCVFAAWFLLVQDDSSPPDLPVSSAPPAGPSSVARSLRYLAVGLVLGALFWLKYNTVVFVPFITLLPFVDYPALDQGSIRLRIPFREWFGRMLVVAAGFVAAIAAVLSSFYFSGAWHALVEVQFEALPRYGAGAFHWSLAYLGFALGRTQDHLGIWWELTPIATLLIAWWRREISRVAPFTLLALGGYLCAAVQWRFHPYYFETVFPLFSVFWAYLCIKTYEGTIHMHRVFTERRWVLARAVLWVLFACLVSSLLPEESVLTVEQYHLAADWFHDPEASYKIYYWQLPLEKIGDQVRVVEYLQAHAAPHDEVYVWGTAALINFLSQRENPSRFITDIGLMATWAPESWRQELVRTLETKRPRYIVVERHDTITAVTFTPQDSEQYLRSYPGLAGILHRDYEPVANYYDFEVYRLATQPRL